MGLSNHLKAEEHETYVSVKDDKAGMVPLHLCLSFGSAPQPHESTARTNFQTFLADVRILELRSPFSASCFNLQLIDVFTNLKDLVWNCGFAIAKSIDDIYIFIRVRIPKLFRDSS
jgi:hypothetical protein